jgi:hypothetical protein
LEFKVSVGTGGTGLCGRVRDFVRYIFDADNASDGVKKRGSYLELFKTRFPALNLKTAR